MQKSKTSRPKRVWLRWAIVIVIGVGLGIFGGNALKILNHTHTSIGSLFSPPFGGTKFVRILVVGEDNTSKMRKNGRGLTDAMMVVALDLDHNTVKAISIPRDTRIDIPGHGTQKLNAANVYGGPELTMSMIQSLVGVNIDYYIKTNIAGLTNIVDLVGGVGVDIEKDMHYTDRRGGLYINLRKGYRHLNGDKALQYVRFRHDALGDITRMERQQKFLRALARQIVSPGNFSKWPTVADQLYTKGYIETNMNLKDLEAIAKIASNVPQDKVVTETAPGTTQTIDRISYYIIDTTKTAELAQQLLMPSSNVKARVEVLNGAGIGGIATKVADNIKLSGYAIASTGNAPNFGYDKTEIIVHNEKIDETEIAMMLRCSNIKRDSNTSTGADITVIVGKDYNQ